MDEAALSVRDGRLYIEHLECSELAARFGTPLYVMSETRDGVARLVFVRVRWSHSLFLMVALPGYHLAIPAAPDLLGGL